MEGSNYSASRRGCHDLRTHGWPIHVNFAVDHGEIAIKHP